MTLYVMLFGRLPFVATTTEKLYEKIMNGRYDVPTRDGKARASPAAVHLLSVCLRVDPDKRWDSLQVLKHPWLHGKDTLVISKRRQISGVELQSGAMPSGSGEDNNTSIVLEPLCFTG